MVPGWRKVLKRRASDASCGSSAGPVTSPTCRGKGRSSRTAADGFATPSPPKRLKSKTSAPDNPENAVAAEPVAAANVPGSSTDGAAEVKAKDDEVKAAEGPKEGEDAEAEGEAE